MSHHLQKRAENAGDVTENVTPPAEKATKCGRCDGKCHTTCRKGPKVREMCLEMSHHLQKRAENAGDVPENVTPAAEKGQKCGRCDGKCHTTCNKMTL